MLKMDMILINHTEFLSDVLFQYPAIVPGVLFVCIRSETTNALNNLLNCMSPFFTLIPKISNKNT